MEMYFTSRWSSPALSLFLLLLHSGALAAGSSREVVGEGSCGDEQDDGVALLMHMRAAAKEAENCSSLASNSPLVEEVLSSAKIPLTGQSTGNPPYEATVLEPFGQSSPVFPPQDVMYGSGQEAIEQDKRHCAKKFNNYTMEDFDAAWDYLACELNRLFSNPTDGGSGF
ncbi:unnamed protein product [Prorocentrum cordatum]|uniref:Uncharacterized protein n=1 Tax=Prorocentrum cordatum TaxID=2364126 RepID=A0ABN9Y8A5_9DINO|nr:unnamed protein product [Polarella glacialis]